MRLQATLLLALALLQVAAASNIPRQATSSDTTSSTSSSSSTTSSSSSTTSTTTSSSTTSSSTSDTSTPTSSTTSSSSTTNPPQQDPTVTPTPNPPQQSTVVTTQQDGEVVTEVRTATASSTTLSAAPSNTSPGGEEDDSPALGTGAIVGMSVAGGLALIGIIAFFIWKFTRKRSSFDDNEAIKWPDLNSHTAEDSAVALPVHTTGRTGGFDSQSETTGSLMHADNYSTADFSASNDPYAVPPLPHLNPNQPYRDDPTGASGYYDPYHGPVPGTLEHGSDWHGEAIPMQQIQHQQTGGGAPGYDQVGFEQPGYNAGRASPGPHAAFAGGQLGRTGSPAPQGIAPPYQQGYDPQAGRQSPGPQQAFGGRMSPGPNMAYNTSGYPQAAAPGYDAYGPR